MSEAQHPPQESGHPTTSGGLSMNSPSRLDKRAPSGRRSSLLERIQSGIFFGGALGGTLGGNNHGAISSNGTTTHKRPAGRPSMLFNEDDYDYAIELMPDDEYRQAAEALPDIVDFDEVELIPDDDLLRYHMTHHEDSDDENENKKPKTESRRMDVDELYPDHIHYFSETLTKNNSPFSTGGDKDIEANYHSSPSPTQKQKQHHAKKHHKDSNYHERNPSFATGVAEKFYDTTITGMGTGPLNSSTILRTRKNESFGIIGKREFATRFSQLTQLKQRAERAARRSSIGFQRQFIDKDAMDKFLIMMNRGIHVRRHQSHKVAETVRLFSTTGLIVWEKANAQELFRQRQQEGLVSGGAMSRVDGNSAQAVYNSTYDRSMFDFFIAICGCGDDLVAGNDHRHQQGNSQTNTNSNNSSSKSTSNASATTDEANLVGIGRYFYNFGFKRHGDFEDLDILSIHPATKEDPTMPGQFATETLRKSKDTYNPDLTFSIVYQDYSNSNNNNNSGSDNLLGSSCVSTLDIECVSLETYMILLKGFKMLQEEAERERSEYCRGGVGANGGRAYRQPLDPISAMWIQTKAVVTSALSGSKDEEESSRKQEHHPVDDLYAPSISFEPFRALRVGGGLVHKGGLLSSPVRKSLSQHGNNNNGNGSVKSHSPCRPTVAKIGGHAPIGRGGFANGGLPVAQFLGWKSAGTQIWARLKMAGLDVKCVFSWDLSRVILKVRCPKWRLEQMAEQMHMKIKTKDGYLKPFRINRRDTFALNGVTSSSSSMDGGSCGTGIFRSSERQQIIDYILRSKIKDGGAELDEHTELGAYIVQRFPLHMYSRLVDIRHSWITFWKREKPGTISQPFSIFSQSYRTSWRYLFASIKHVYDNILNQPLDHIAEYFGETIAFYFAFMAFYTRWLVFPSILGIIVFGIQMSTRKLDHWLCAPYALVIMLWISFMLAFWRQKSSALAYKWGVLDYEVEETERPQFKGKYIYDEFTGEIRKSYPLWRRFVRYMISVPVLCSFIFCMLVIMTTTFYSQDLLYNSYVEGRPLSLTPAFPSFTTSTADSTSSNVLLNSTSRMLFDLTADSSSISLTELTFSPTFAPTLAPMDSSTTWGRQITMEELFNADFWAATFFYPCLYGMVVSILTMLFNTVALVLNEFENHRTQTIFLNRLILKVFSFQFVTIFTSLYYYAFFSKDVDGGFTRISVTIFSLMTVGQWWQVFLDIALPSFYHRLLMYRLRANFAITNRKIYKVREMIAAMEAVTSANAAAAKEKEKEAKKNGGSGSSDGRTSTLAVPSAISSSQDDDDVNSGDPDAAEAAAALAKAKAEATAAKDALLLQQQHEIQAKLEKRIKFLAQAKSKCWEEALQAKYNVFSDYTTLVIQMCFILFFGAVFPLAPLLAFINNLLLIRFKAIKICYTRQRPIAQKIGGIGVWNDVLQILSVGGALTNCALLGFVSTPIRAWLIPSVGQTGLALILFGFEQVLLLFKYWLHTSIPSVPPSVARAQLRERKSLLSKRSWLMQEQEKEKREREKKDREKKEKERKDKERKERAKSSRGAFLGLGMGGSSGKGWGDKDSDDHEDNAGDHQQDGEHDGSSPMSPSFKKGKKHSLLDYVIGTVSAVSGAVANNTHHYSQRFLSARYSPTRVRDPHADDDDDDDESDDRNVNGENKQYVGVSPAAATVHSHRLSPLSPSHSHSYTRSPSGPIRSPSRSISPATSGVPFPRDFSRANPGDVDMPVTRHPFQRDEEDRDIDEEDDDEEDLPPEESYEEEYDDWEDEKEEGEEYYDEEEGEQEEDELESYMLRPPSNSDFEDADCREEEDQQEEDYYEEELDEEEDNNHYQEERRERSPLEKQVSFQDDFRYVQHQHADEEVEDDEEEREEIDDNMEDDDDDVSALSYDQEEFRGLDALPFNAKELQSGVRPKGVSAYSKNQKQQQRKQAMGRPLKQVHQISQQQYPQQPLKRTSPLKSSMKQPMNRSPAPTSSKAMLQSTRMPTNGTTAVEREMPRRRVMPTNGSAAMKKPMIRTESSHSQKRKGREHEHNVLQSLAPPSSMHKGGVGASQERKTQSKPSIQRLREYPSGINPGTLTSVSPKISTGTKKSSNGRSPVHRVPQDAYPHPMPLPVSTMNGVVSSSPSVSASSSSKKISSVSVAAEMARLAAKQKQKLQRSDRSTRHLFPPSQPLSPFAYINEERPQPSHPAAGRGERQIEKRSAREQLEMSDDAELIENSPRHGNRSNHHHHAEYSPSQSPSRKHRSPSLSPSPKPMLAGRSRSPARDREVEQYELVGHHPPTPPPSRTAGLTSTRSPVRTPVKSPSPMPLTPSQSHSHSKANKRASLSLMQHHSQGQSNPFSFAAGKGKTGHPEKIDFFE